MQILRRIFRRYSAPEAGRNGGTRRAKQWKRASKEERQKERAGGAGEKGNAKAGEKENARAGEKGNARAGEKGNTRAGEKGTQKREKKRTQEQEKKGTQEREKKGTQEREKKAEKQSPGDRFAGTCLLSFRFSSH
ncbi:hypothetical protein [Alistipes sp.]|uniref:hypothetical protein n=1 Tax=Alistipes sp. TaxID=1872444 RepID=UPI003AB7D75D